MYVLFIPITFLLLGISLRTIAPAPTITLSPILTPCFIKEFAPINVFLPTETSPAKTAPGAT